MVLVVKWIGVRLSNAGRFVLLGDNHDGVWRHCME
jgi:hypothetical protein